jgi:hypothetical protein
MILHGTEPQQMCHATAAVRLSPKGVEVWKESHKFLESNCI